MKSIKPILDNIRELVIQNNGNSFVQLEKIINTFQRDAKIQNNGMVLVHGKCYQWADVNLVICHASEALECLKARNAGAYLDGSYHEQKINEILQRAKERNRLRVMTEDRKRY